MVYLLIFVDGHWSIQVMTGSIIVMNHSKLISVVAYCQVPTCEFPWCTLEGIVGLEQHCRDETTLSILANSCCTLRRILFGTRVLLIFAASLIYAYNQPMFHNPNPLASTEILLVVTGGHSVTTAFEGWNVAVKKLGNTSTSPKLNHTSKPAKFNCIAKGCLSIPEFSSSFLLAEKMISKPALFGACSTRMSLIACGTGTASSKQMT